MQTQWRKVLSWLKSPCFVIGFAILLAIGGLWANQYYFVESIEFQNVQLQARNERLTADNQDLEKELDYEERQPRAPGGRYTFPKSNRGPASVPGQNVEPLTGQAKILFTVVPGLGSGPDALAPIEGRVEGIENPSGFKILLYAHTNRWYVEPFADQPLTDIDSTGGWKNETHLGQQYAALVVLPTYSPQSAPEELPPVGGGVIAKEIVPANIK
jgi:hypothetical protein